MGEGNPPVTGADDNRPGAPLPPAGRGRGGGRPAARPAAGHATSWEREAVALAPPKTRAIAGSLRKRLTDPERRLWWYLRHGLNLPNTHFRRQVAIGLYVADFCCLRARLIIEVDGNQHGFDEKAAHDAKRTADLARQGFRVLRFSNREAMTATRDVLDTILAALGPTPPTPGPSPRGGGERVEVL